MADFREALRTASPLLLGLGQQLAGQNPAGLSAGAALMSQEAEKAKRKANIQGLLDSMQLSQQKRAFLEMLPFEQASPIIWDLMNPKPVGGGRAPTQEELAAQFAASLGDMGAAPQQAQAGGGFSMGVPDDFGSPVAASGGLSMGMAAVESPAPATTQGLSFGNIQTKAPAPVNAGNLYETAKRKLAAEIPTIIKRIRAGDPAASAYLEQQDKLLKRLEMFAPQTPDQSATEEKIALLMETGLSRNAAISAAVRYEVSRDPLTQTAVLIDKATGQIVGAAPASPEAPPAGVVTPPAESPSLQFGDQFQNAGQAFGIGGAARGLANTALDTTFGITPFPETRQAQSDFEVFGESLINAFSSAYGRQPPSWLLKNIEKLTPQPGVFEGPGEAQDKLRSMARDLESRRAGIERSADRRMAPGTRSDLEAQIAGIDATLEQIYNALGGFGGIELSPEVEDRLKAYE